MTDQRLLSGTKEAIQYGITTQTEMMIGSGCNSNPKIRLNDEEEKYIISHLIQKNFDKRRGLSAFKSKTKRSIIGQKKPYVVIPNNIPPPGFYLPKYVNK